MSTHCVKRQTAIGKVKRFLREWDHGNKTVRRRMLNTFLSENTGKTCQELEQEFTQGASLFLARLTAWLRLTYMFGTCLGLQLKAIGVFLSATNNQQYLIQFLEIGGVLTVLEILGQRQTGEEDRAEALHLLQQVSNAGRRSKELICESHGVRAIAECLVGSNAEETQERARALLESLAHGNPKYQNHVYKGLVALLSCAHPTAQQLVLQTLRIVQSKLTTAHPSIVEPLLGALRSLRLDVHYEAIELISDLLQYEVRAALLSGLVALLKHAKEGCKRHDAPDDPEITKTTESLPVFVQQAAAAKAIRLLSQGSEEVSQELLSLRVVHHLLHAMGNRELAEAQIQASLALQHFVRTYPAIEEQVCRGMDSTLFAAFMSSAENLHMNMDEIQAEILLPNKINIKEGLDRQTS